MGDPREDLTLLELENQGIPRIRVTPQPPPQPEQVYNPPPGHVGEWPRGTVYREVPPEPSLPPMQGRAPLEPDLTPANQWQPPRTPWQDAQAIGGLVRQGFNRFLAGPPAENRQRFEGPYTAPQAAGAVIGALVDPARRSVESQQIRSDPNADPLTQEQARQAGPGAAAEVSMNLAGINAPFAAARPGLGVFGSRMGRHFDPEKEKLAIAMEKNGASPEQIWKHTGTMRGKDNIWIQEIPDIAASFKGDQESIARRIFDKKNPSLKGRFDEFYAQRADAMDEASNKLFGTKGFKLTLDEVIDHPELFAAYPELRSMPVSHDAFMEAMGGYIARSENFPKGKIIYRETDDKPTRRGSTFETLLHEIQHGIANIEGMAKGASGSTNFEPGSIAAKLYEAQMKQAPKNLSLADEVKWERQAREYAANESYRRSAGEGLARIPPQRKDMSPEQLAAIYPGSQMYPRLQQQLVEYNAPFTAAAPELQAARNKPGSILGAPAVLKGSDIPVEQIIELGHIPRGTNRAWMLNYDPTSGAAALKADPGHGFSGLVTGKRPEDMVAGYTGAPLNIPQRTFDPSELEGKTAVLGVTDRTFGNQGALNQIGSTVLQRPVPQEGGINFPTMHAGKKLPDVPKDVDPLFASVSKGAAGRITNYAKAVQEAGGDPFFTTINMAHIAGDSSKQVAKTALQVAKQSKPSDDTIKAIDNAMGLMMTGLKGKPPTPYPGFADKNIEKWLDDAGLAYRSAFVKALDTSKVQKAGGPDIGEVRFGNTDPRLYSTPTGSAGLVLGRMRPEVGYRETQLSSNYPYTIFGEKGEIGGLPGSVPFPLFAPDLHRLLLPRTNRFGKSFADLIPYYTMQGFPGGAPPTQKMTPEVIDYLGRWFRKHPQGWTAAGAVPLGAETIGSLVDPSKYEARQ